MDISFDPVKRAATLQERGLDFADAGEVFAGVSSTIEDRRFNYGEVRFTTADFLAGLFVIVVWTPRGVEPRGSPDNARHIISMGQGHAKERRRW